MNQQLISMSMLALLFCPIKGDANYPPLAVSILSAYLKENQIQVTNFDFNKQLYIENPELAELYSFHFGYPSVFSGYTDNNNQIRNIDTIYNLELLLHMLFGSKLLLEITEDTKHFIGRLNSEIDSKAKYLLDKGFDCFGFSTYISNIAYSCLLAKRLKELNPNITIFFGGSSTSYKPIRDFLLEMSISDYIIVGEGENAVLKLIKDLTKSPIEHSYKVLFSENIAPPILKDNEVKVPIISNLDDLPFPDFSSLDLSIYSPSNKDYKVLPIYSSRGCINQCAYCSETQYWSRFRQKSVNRVLDEIKYSIEKYSTNSFYFHDSLINGNVKWLMEFCDSVIAEKLNIQWFSFASVQNLNYELLLKMKESGCSSLTFGIEHTSPQVLKKMNKISSLEKAQNVLEATIKAGILPVANIIYGLVGEEDGDFLNLLSFVAKPQFKGKVYFTFRAFEIRVGSVISNKIIANRENIINRENKYLSHFAPNIRSILSDIDIYWYAGDEYITNLLNKLNIINVFMNSQDTFLNIRRECIRRYDTYPVLRHIISLNKKPVLNINQNVAVCALDMIQQQILEGASKNLTLSEISRNIHEDLNSKMLIDDYDTESVISTLTQVIIDSAIVLTQKNIIRWK